jgi:hypothetical protein
MIASVRIEEWSHESILAMHYFFKSVVHARRGDERIARFCRSPLLARSKI